MPLAQAWRLLLVCLAVLASSRAGSAVALDRPELSGLPADVQAALAAGQVVLLEGALGDRSISTKIIAVIPAPPGDVLDELRDLEGMRRRTPGLRSLTYDRGETQDTYTLEVKPHALLPLMELQRQVTIDEQADGDVQVDVELLSSTYERIEGQSSEWQLLKLGEGSTLAIYQTHDRYRDLPFRNRVLSKVTDGCQDVMGDVLASCAQRAEARIAARLGAPVTPNAGR